MYSAEGRTWGCDCCGVATFRTFEEAAAHEQMCQWQGVDSANRNIQCHGEYDRRGPMKNQGFQHISSQRPIAHCTDRQEKPEGWSYSETQKRLSSYPNHNLSPATNKKWTKQSFLSSSQRSDQRPTPRKLTLLARPQDKYSLSDRQCYVRSNFVEVSEATEDDIRSRHSKGAQKLSLRQVGLRCIFYIHLNPKDWVERAVCYLSSIGRIYQTAADMQRFHFECCPEIPEN
eukprot:13674004-Ditylum_brightwellii.AAC.1